MLQKLRERMGREEGFTLIELLVVMLILGILAAIAIPSFLNQREKANDAQAKADARTAQTAMETFATDNNGSYGAAAAADLVALESTLSDANLTAAGNGTTGYTVTVQSSTGRDFSIIRTNAGGSTTFDYDCDPGGGCPSDGTWN
jgi:type IV pilus assembly protein PilA